MARTCPRPVNCQLLCSLSLFAMPFKYRNANFGSDAEILIEKICEALGRDRKSGEVIPHANYAFSQATDNLIALYRGLERRTVDLPFITITPFLIAIWTGFKFLFFALVGILLIIPTNFVLLIRNLF